MSFVQNLNISFTSTHPIHTGIGNSLYEWHKSEKKQIGKSTAESKIDETVVLFRLLYYGRCIRFDRDFLVFDLVALFLNCFLFVFF